MSFQLYWLFGVILELFGSKGTSICLVEGKEERMEKHRVIGGKLIPCIELSQRGGIEKKETLMKIKITILHLNNCRDGVNVQ